MLAQSLHLNNSGPCWFQKILHEAVFINSRARHWSNIVQIQSIRNFSKLWSLLTSSNHMLSLGANNLPQFDEGNLMCVEFNNLNLKYLSIYLKSFISITRSNRLRAKNIKSTDWAKTQLIKFLPVSKLSLFKSRCFTPPYFDVP